MIIGFLQDILYLCSNKKPLAVAYNMLNNKKIKFIVIERY